MTDATVILTGVTGAGKSATVCTCLPAGSRPRSMPAVGDGSGDSVTAEWTIYRTVFGPWVDGPGLHDTWLRYSKEDRNKLLAAQVLRSTDAGCTQVKHLVVCSLAESHLVVRTTLMAFVETFDKESLRSVVVLLTKADVLEEDALDVRVQKECQVAAELGIPGNRVVVWRNKRCSTFQATRQKRELQTALQRTPGAAMREIQLLENRIARRARALHAAQPRRTRIEVITHRGTRKQRVLEQEYDVVRTYTDWEVVEEPYDDIETYTEWVEEPRVEYVRRGLGGIFGHNHRQVYYVDVKKTRERKVTKWRRVEKPVPRLQWGYVDRWSEKDVPYSEEENREVPEPLLPVQEFMHRAAEEVCEEARKAICCR